MKQINKLIIWKIKKILKYRIGNSQVDVQKLRDLKAFAYVGGYLPVKDRAEVEAYFVKVVRY